MQKFLVPVLLCFGLTGCQISYYLKSGYNQALLIKNQNSIKDVLKDPNLNETKRRKLLLILETKDFAEKNLGLKQTNNYTTYVELHRPYVSHIIHVAYPFELKYRMWSFPVVGELPYKGFFEKQDAVDEANIYNKEGFDTHVRGVRAYSTLGWMKDPVLSSMLDYDDDDLVNLIIHELTHSTLFIKNSVDFNEQLAMFVGNKGTELFFKSKNNDDILKTIHNKNNDDKLFSDFINTEYIALDNWYKNTSAITPALKKQKFEDMKKRFKKIPFQSQQYSYFTKMELNNASFLGFKTYYKDLSGFERVFDKTKSMEQFLSLVKTLESKGDPEVELKKL